jgi:hypothetical protein
MKSASDDIGPSGFYEVVSGQVLLWKRRDFYRLHSGVLLPIMGELGIRPVMLLMTEVGRYGRFLDVYHFDSLGDYQAKTDQLLAHPAMGDYYREVGQCIHGSLLIELMQELPYARNWLGD